MIKICFLGQHNIRFITKLQFIISHNIILTCSLNIKVLTGVNSRENSNFLYFGRKHEGMSGHSGPSEFREVGTS